MTSSPFEEIYYSAMSGSGRHSHDSSSGGRTPSSYAYADQPMSGQQYLRPEDVYRLEREGGYFNATSHSQSRHGSETTSPRHNVSPADQTPSRHSNPHSPYIEYPYTDLSRHSSGGDSGFGSSRRVTPPDQSSTSSRHSPTGSHGDSPKDKEHARGSSAQGSPKGKGKERADDRHDEATRRSSGGGRHGSGDSGSSRRTMIGPVQARLVSGVFIRY